jgi:drug/metabolite transporter (DMT)-like permease
MKDLKGYIMVLGAALFWGGSATAAKFLLNRNVDTVVIVEARVTFTALLLLPWLCVVHPSALRVPFRELWKFLLVGVAGVAGSNFFYYFTIRESTVATGILIQYTAPFLVMAYAAWAREERMSAIKVSAAFLSLLGCFLAVGAYGTGVVKVTRLSLATGLASAICFAFLNVYTRRLLRQFAFWTVTFYAIAGASLFWLVLRPPWTLFGPAAPPSPWAGLFVLAVVSILIPHSLYFNGLRFIVPSRAIITSTVEPVFAIGSAAFVLGEMLTSWQVAGAVLVLAAILLLQVRREPVHPLTHGSARAGDAPH